MAVSTVARSCGRRTAPQRVADRRTQAPRGAARDPQWSVAETRCL